MHHSGVFHPIEKKNNEQYKKYLLAILLSKFTKKLYFDYN